MLVWLLNTWNDWIYFYVCLPIMLKINIIIQFSLDILLIQYWKLLWVCQLCLTRPIWLRMNHRKTQIFTSTHSWDWADSSFRIITFFYAQACLITPTWNNWVNSLLLWLSSHKQKFNVIRQLIREILQFTAAYCSLLQFNIRESCILIELKVFGL